MASLEVSDDSNEGSLDGVQFPEIFQNIFQDKITPFKERLAPIQKNEFGDVWSDEREKHVKTMRHANTFVSDIVEAFRVQYDTVSKEIEGSTCDEFQHYFHKQLNIAVSKTGMLENSLKETKKIFDLQISDIKEKFEKKETKGSTSKSDIDEVISKTELMDPVHVNHALLCCRVAYECKDLENPKQCLKKCATEHWLSELVVSYEDKAVPRYVMARCGDVLYVAFRGLESTLYTTTVGSVIPSTSFDGLGQVNSIIYEEAKKIPLSYFTQEIIQEKRVVLTGHSTGGAVATLVTVLLMERLMQFQLPQEFLKRNLKCITFGVTPVCDKNLKEYVESTLDMKECFCHYVKHDDIIPKLFRSNISEIQEKLIKLIMDLVQPAIAVTGVLSPVVVNGIRVCWSGIVAAVLLKNPQFKLLPAFDIVGIYYILNPSKDGGVTKCTDEEAVRELSIQLQEICESWMNLLINHRIDKYDSDIRDAVIKEYSPALNSLLSHHETKKPSDIIPIVNGVQFQKYEGKVVAKIIGENMWFVHEVKMHGVEPLPDVDVADVANNAETLLPINISKNTGSSVEVELDAFELLKYATVNVKVKSHLENSQPDEHGTDVKTCIKSYGTTKRQEGLAELELYEVIELAFLNAILESRNEEDNGERYSTMMFFKDILNVVPIESLLYAIAQSDIPTVVEGCKLLLKNKPLFSKFEKQPCVRQAAQLALKRLKELCQSNMGDADGKKQANDAKVYLDEFLRSKSKEQKRLHQCLGALNLDSSLVERLENWRKELHSSPGRTNDEMLKTLNGIEEEFKVCNELFNAFINVDIAIPMEPQTGMSNDGYVVMFGLAVITAVKAGRFGIWGAVGAGGGHLAYQGYKHLCPDTRKVPNYAEKLAFLLTSMEKNPVTDKATVPVYYLERRLVEQCVERGIHAFTKVREVRRQWDTAFKEETLHLVDKNYRGIISSWIIYSLMINSLRENLAKKTAVGVIGLLNSGKSTLVKSLFGIETATGTMVKSRTTVPYIYSLEDEVEELEVIDFPGVNDQDKSISELANLLVRLTRVVVFVVDYRNSRSKATVEWLKILDENNVPVLVCLSFADKLFAENMLGGCYPDQKEVKEKLDKERDRIKEEICQSKQAKQDFEFMVLSFDNDSCLNSNEAKKKLVEAGLKDELDVGRWIAKTFQENKQEELSKRLLDFVAKKQSSTLQGSSA